MSIESNFKVEFKLKFKGNENDLSKLQKIIDHHIDQLLNLDEFPEIASVYDANIKEIIRCKY